MSNTNKKINVLVMISTHGTWGTTHKDKAAQLKEHYQNACKKVSETLSENQQDIQLYLGYDGDGVQFDKKINSDVLVPPTLLLLMLINTFSSSNPTLIQCQGINDAYGLPQPFSYIATHLDKDTFQDYEEEFVNTFKEKEEVKKEVKDILKSNKNITLAYNRLEKIENPKNPKKALPEFISYNLQLDTPGDKYGGVDEKGNLVDSTKGWDFYFKNTPKDAPKFKKVYYLPVWKDEYVSNDEKKWGDKTITKQIAEACKNPQEKPLFSNNNGKIIVINDFCPTYDVFGFPNDTNGGGRRSRKRTRRSKRRKLSKSSRRKSLRRKRLSKRK